LAAAIGRGAALVDGALEAGRDQSLMALLRGLKRLGEADVIGWRVDGGLERRPAPPPGSPAEVLSPELEDVEDDVLKGRALGARTMGAPRGENRAETLEVMAYDAVRSSPEGD